MQDHLTTIPASFSSLQLHTGTPSTQNPARVYLASLAAGSVRTMRECLDKIADIAQPGCTLDDVPWGALRYEHVIAIRARLVDAGLSAASCNKHLSALRSVLKNAWRLGQMTAEEYLRAADVPAVKGEGVDQAAGRALSTGELMAMVAACDTMPIFNPMTPVVCDHRTLGAGASSRTRGEGDRRRGHGVLQ